MAKLLTLTFAWLTAAMAACEVSSGNSVCGASMMQLRQPSSSFGGSGGGRMGGTRLYRKDGNASQCLQTDDGVCIEIEPVAPSAGTGALLLEHAALLSHASERNGMHNDTQIPSEGVSFSCQEGAPATCNTNCQARNLRIQGAFLITDEDQGRDENPAWEACGFVRMIDGGAQQQYDLDYSCGCAGNTAAARRTTYMNQEHSASTASCGLVVVGLDIYTQVEGWGDSSQTQTLDGETWTYIRQDDLDISADLVSVMREVESGQITPGTYVYGYTFDYPDGCQVTYKMDFTVPAYGVNITF